MFQQVIHNSYWEGKCARQETEVLADSGDNCCCRSLGVAVELGQGTDRFTQPYQLF